MLNHGSLFGALRLAAAKSGKWRPRDPRSKWRQPFTCFVRPVAFETKGTILKANERRVRRPAPSTSGGGAKKSRGGRRKSLKRLDPRKTNAWISFRFSLDSLPEKLGFPSDPAWISFRRIRTSFIGAGADNIHSCDG
jgi:hypothetical protein